MAGPTNDPFQNNNSNATSATAAADQQLSNGSTSGANAQTTYYPFNVYTGIKQTNNIRGSRGLRQQGIPAQTNVGSLMSGGDHMGLFYKNWNDNPVWRTELIAGYLAAGGNPKDTTDSWAMQSLWQDLGKASAASMETGHAMTPMQILKFMAGKKGALASQQAKSSAQSMVRDITNTTYTIEDPATALALTQNVLTAALGRQASPDEVRRYTSAIQSYDRSNPTIDHMHQDANGNQTSTRSGGVTQQGESALISNTVNNSAEGQAYQTNSVFDQAMKILSGL
jgi:hypothetical protein